MDNTQNLGQPVGKVTTTYNGEKIQVNVYADRSVILPDGTVRKVKQEVVDALIAKNQAMNPASTIVRMAPAKPRMTQPEPNQEQVQQPAAQVQEPAQPSYQPQMQMPAQPQQPVMPQNAAVPEMQYQNEPVQQGYDTQMNAPADMPAQDIPAPVAQDPAAEQNASDKKRMFHKGKGKDKPEKEESEEKKPDGTAQESAQENPANRSADDYNYPDFCGRLYIPAAGIDVALYNNTSQDTCNRTDSAAIFPHRPEDGGSNIVADNELESLTSVAVGSTAYVITPGGQQINYVCVDAFNGHNDVTGYDALQKDDGTVVWGSAELIVYTCLGDAYNVRVACFNRA